MSTVGDPPWFRKCLCGKSFYKPNSFSNHIRTCGAYKAGVGNALENAKARYATKRKQKKGKEAIESWYGQGDDALDIDQDIAMAEPLAPSPPPEAPPPPPPPMGRGQRIRAPPQIYKDFLVTSVIPLEIPMFGQAIESPPESPTPGPSNVLVDSPLSEARRNILNGSHWRKSRKNGFNIYKRYWTLEDRPHDPDLFLSSSDLWDDEDTPPLESRSGDDQIQTNSANPYSPFPNWSSYKLGEWYWNEGGKSRQSFQQLVSIIGDEDFVSGDIRHTNWKRVDSILASSEFEDDFAQENARWADDGTSWKTTPITIDVPFNSASKKPGSKPFVLSEFRFRPLLPVIQAKLQDKAASEHFHIVPSELWWDREDCGGGVRMYGDLYNSDAFLDAYREVQLLPAEENEDLLPRYVVALMFASDETHLTSFGDAQIWPVYMHYGNDSKYRRAKPSLKLFEEVAYFQKLPDSFSDWYLEHSGKNAVPGDVTRHVKRELFQAQWEVLLDDDFIYAHKHGLVVDSPDGVRRRFYPRILTYSADYPERMRVVGVRTTGGCPCARCLVNAEEIPQLGTPNDRNIRMSRRRNDDDSKKEKVREARKLIYGPKAYAVNAERVEALLKPTSLVAAKNAFSDRLGSLGFDIYAIPAVDILHEVEIGAWKSLLIHLIRLLEATGTGKTNVLNARFRQVPTFGRDTIRRFRHNVSAMKQLGARDLEDLLQCSLPVFEGLFPGDHDGRVQDMIFSMAHWHALAKLRMHTDVSLELLDLWTTVLGETSRVFSTLTCSQFKTRELNSEYQARKRKEARQSAKTQHSRKANKKVQDKGPVSVPLADLEDIQNPPPPPGLGPVRNESSQQQVDGRKQREWSLTTPKYHSLGDVVPYIRRTGTTDSYSTQLNFLSKLKRHLLPRVIASLIQEVTDNPEHYPDACLPILNAASSADPSEQDIQGVYFHSDVIYRHTILQIPYTTYDCRQDVDTINPNTSRRDFMCLSAQGTEEEPSSEGTTDRSGDYVYGRILGIFHANVMYGGPGSLDYRRRRFDFLWVRWYEAIPRAGNGGWSSKRLDRVRMAPMSEASSWDFVDPSHILRGAHIIPRFSLGPLHDTTDDGKRIFSKAAQDRLDWKEYYINRFVDRDMTMRFHKGSAAGHLRHQADNSTTVAPSSADPSEAVAMEVDPGESTTSKDFPSSRVLSSKGDEDLEQDSDDGSEQDSDDDSEQISDEDQGQGDNTSSSPEPDSEEELDIYG